jgi:hypothetical protein
MPNADLHERIKRHAYLLWEQEGRPEGRAEEHWRQAAAELRAETELAGVHPGAGGGDDQGHARAPSDLAADEAAEGGGGVGP